MPSRLFRACAGTKHRLDRTVRRARNCRARLPARNFLWTQGFSRWPQAVQGLPQPQHSLYGLWPTGKTLGPQKISSRQSRSAITSSSYCPIKTMFGSCTSSKQSRRHSPPKMKSFWPSAMPKSSMVNHCQSALASGAEFHLMVTSNVRSAKGALSRCCCATQSSLGQQWHSGANFSHSSSLYQRTTFTIAGYLFFWRVWAELPSFKSRSCNTENTTSSRKAWFRDWREIEWPTPKAEAPWHIWRKSPGCGNCQPGSPSAMLNSRSQTAFKTRSTARFGTSSIGLSYPLRDLPVCREFSENPSMRITGDFLEVRSVL